MAIVGSIFRLLLFVAGISAAAASSNANLPNPQDALLEKFDRLGSIDGKIYFAEVTSFRNWSDDKQMCQDYGMQLASIVTKIAETFLAGKLDVTAYFMWTSGRDALTLDQFVWDSNNNETLDPDLDRDNVQIRASIQTCLAFHQGTYGLLPCSARTHTLCEMPIEDPTTPSTTTGISDSTGNTNGSSSSTEAGGVKP